MVNNRFDSLFVYFSLVDDNKKIQLYLIKIFLQQHEKIRIFYGIWRWHKKKWKMFLRNPFLARACSAFFFIRRGNRCRRTRDRHYRFRPIVVRDATPPRLPLCPHVTALLVTFVWLPGQARVAEDPEVRPTRRINRPLCPSSLSLFSPLCSPFSRTENEGVIAPFRPSGIRPLAPGSGRENDP